VDRIHLVEVRNDDTGLIVSMPWVWYRGITPDNTLPAPYYNPEDKTYEFLAVSIDWWKT
jgi:hypothetical protein